MSSFQKTVFIIAVFLLIFTLIVIAIALKKAETSQTWPPIVSECPDYWYVDGSGNNTKCVNLKDLGTCNPSSGHLTMNFNIAPFDGSNSTCEKYNWANKCGISWDGITYGVSNPCQTE
jgi:hypothetical protein